MNIMLLAMSTYPRDQLSQCKATFNGKIYSYFTQLEPGCKHFFCELADRGEKFDKVIVLCTKETNLKNKGKCIISGNKSMDISDITPYDFFKNRMVDFIMNDDAYKYEEDLGLDTDGFIRFSRPDLYKDVDFDVLFDPVEVDNSDLKIAEAIKHIIFTINEMPSGSDEQTSVYMNAQGGSRTTIQIINTVLSMLKSRNYILKGVNVIDFDSEKNKIRDEFPILNVTGSYLMNDLASAMNAFLQYGRGDMFTNYYSHYKMERNRTTVPEEDITKAVNNISDAILLCDIDGFINGIDRLECAVEAYEKSDANDKDPFFELIVSDIKKSYQELFDSKCITADIDLLVDWCLKRKLIQQAATILEAKTPGFVFKYGFIYGIKNEETKQGLIKLRSNTPKKIDYKFKDPIYYFVNTFCLHSSTNKGGNLKANIHFISKPTFIDYMKNAEYRFKFDKDRENNCVEIGLYSLWFSEIDKIYPNDNDDQKLEKAKDIMKRFVVCYRRSCIMRNKVNHSIGSELSVQDAMQYFNQIITDMNNVLKEIKALYKNSGIKDVERPFFTENEISAN